MKLYLLTTKLGEFYVVATTATIAEEYLIEQLDKADYGFFNDRKVTNIKILAEKVTDFPAGKPNFSGGANLLIQLI